MSIGLRGALGATLLALMSVAASAADKVTIGIVNAVSDGTLFIAQVDDRNVDHFNIGLQFVRVVGGQLQISANGLFIKPLGALASGNAVHGLRTVVFSAGVNQSHEHPAEEIANHGRHEDANTKASQGNHGNQHDGRAKTHFADPHH